MRPQIFEGGGALPKLDHGSPSGPHSTSEARGSGCPACESGVVSPISSTSEYEAISSASSSNGLIAPQTGSRRRVLQYGFTCLLTALAPGGLSVTGRAAAQESNTAAERRVLSISASNAPPYVTPQRTGFEDRLFTEVFRRLGIEVRIYDVPSQRGLVLLNEGQDDGTLARNPGMSKRFPNLVPFTEKALDREYMIYTTRPDIEAAGWDGLAGYSVGIVNGWKILERNITAARSLTKVRDGAQLFRLLNEGRVDLVVFNRWGGLYLLRELAIKGVRTLEPPLARREVFFYLHKSHQELIPRASEVLRGMKQDGSYQQLVDETLGPLTS